MKKDKLYILGAGTPTPTESRFGSAYVLDIDGEKIMFDCGPAATHKLVKSGLWPTEIDYLFFTHHHFDHDICLLYTSPSPRDVEESRMPSSA